MADKKRKNSGGKNKDSKEKRYYPPCTNRIHLKTHEDCRRLLSSVINDLRQQKIDPCVAKTMIYGLQTLLQVFEAQLLDTDIKELLEFARLKQQGGKASCLRV